MFAVYASEGNIENPLASLVVGERPDPIASEGWVRVKGFSRQPEPARHLHLDGRNRAGEPHCFPDDSGK